MRSRVVASIALAALTAGCAGHSILPSSSGPASGDAMRGPQAATLPLGVKIGVPEQSLGSTHFVVALPLRNEAELDRTLEAISDPQSPQYRQFISRSAFLERYAPSAANLAALARELQRNGFTVSVMDQAVSVGGTQPQVERYFGTTFERTSAGALSPRSELRVPSVLSSLNARIIGLSGTPDMQTFSHIVPAMAVQPDNFVSKVGPYFAVDLKQAYAMPSYQESTGKGATIAIVIDAAVKQSDLNAYFKNMRLPNPPKITVKKVDGGGTSASGLGEGTLDVEQSAGIAPGAKLVIYDPSSLGGQGVYDAYSAIVSDGNATVVNSSFGLCESELSTSNLAAFDGVFKQGIAAGVTWVAASGDHGAYQCGFSGTGPSAQPTFAKIGVSWPAVSPYVLAVGGTNLTTNFVAKSNDSAYVSESAFKDTKPSNGGLYWGSGGGYSTKYKRPSWQNGFVSKSGRGMPDVALHMGGLGFSGSQCDAQKCAPGDSSDIELQGGKEFYAIGTSASSPDLVGMIALATQLANTPLGDVHPLLYTLSKTKGLFRHGIPGNNGLPSTSGAWDPVLGLGTPMAAYKILGGKTVAGTPGSSTNP